MANSEQLWIGSRWTYRIPASQQYRSQCKDGEVVVVRMDDHRVEHPNIIQVEHPYIVQSVAVPGHWDWANAANLEAIGTKDHPPDDLAALISVASDAVESGEASYELAQALRAAAGAVAWLEARVKALSALCYPALIADSERYRMYPAGPGTVGEAMLSVGLFQANAHDVPNFEDYRPVQDPTIRTADNANESRMED